MTAAREHQHRKTKPHQNGRPGFRYAGRASRDRLDLPIKSRTTKLVHEKPGRRTVTSGRADEPTVRAEGPRGTASIGSAVSAELGDEKRARDERKKT